MFLYAPAFGVSGRAVALSLFVVVLCGCGGGGSGGGSTALPDQSTSDPSVALTIDEEAALRAVPSLFQGHQRAYQLYHSVVQATLNVVSMGELINDSSCGGLGQSLVEIVDEDASDTLSAGDRVLIQWRDCSLTALRGPVTGAIELSLTEARIDRPSADYILAGALLIEEPLEVVESSATTAPNFREGVTRLISGRLDFRVVTKGNTGYERLSITSFGDEELRIVRRGSATGDDVEMYRNLVVTRTQDRDLEGSFSELSVSARIESGYLGGALDCSTTSPLRGDSGNFPTSGVYECAGASGGRLSVSAALSFSAVSYAYAQSDGSAETVLEESADGRDLRSWRAFVDSILLAGESPSAYFGNVDEARLLEPEQAVAIVANDVVLDAPGGRLYVANTNGVQVIDVDTLATIESVRYQRPAVALAPTDDASTLWVGFSGNRTIRSLSSQDLSFRASVNLEFNAQSADDLEITPGSIAAVPGSVDRLVVSNQRGSRVVAVDQGVTLPDRVEFYSGPVRLNVSDQGAVVAVADRSSGDEVYEMSLDASGIELVTTYDGFAPRGARAVHGLSEGYVTSAGYHFDTGEEIVTNLYGGSEMVALATDVDRNRIYALDREGYLHLMQMQPRALLARYRIFEGYSVYEATLLAGSERLLVLAAGALSAYSMAKLENEVPDSIPCERVDHSQDLDVGTVLDLRCSATAVAVDPARNRLYLALDYLEGASGNSVAVVSLATGEVAESVPLGITPTRLHLSADGSALYATSSGSSEIVRIDPASLTVTARFSSGVRSRSAGLVSSPEYPLALGANPLDADELVLLYSSSRNVAHFRGRLRSERLASAEYDAFAVNFLARGDRAMIVSRDELQVLEVAPEGVTELSQVRLSSNVERSALVDDVLLFEDGKALNLDTLTGEPTCAIDLDPGTYPVVGSDPSSGRRYYVSLFNERFRISACAPQTGAIAESPFYVVIGGTLGQLRGVYATGDGRLALHFSNRVVLVDEPDLD